jgi:hypothetical protein
MGKWAHPTNLGRWYGEKIGKRSHSNPLDGSQSVILAIPTAVKVAGLTPWIHHSQIKEAQPLQTPTTGRPIAIAGESSSPAPATSQKLVGQNMVEA